MNIDVSVLRYGHRLARDTRVTTHCCLVARAFGAKEIILSGKEEPEIIKKVNKINDSWGGKFKVKFESSWKKAIKEKKKDGYLIVHLTMYGLPLNKTIEKMKKKEKILVVIGSQKVEKSVYDESDINVSIGTQPHSEISSLSVFLDRLLEGKELNQKFKGKIEIIPSKKGKKFKKQ